MVLRILIEWGIFNIELVKIILCIHVFINYQFKERMIFRLLIIVVFSLLIQTGFALANFTYASIENINMILLMLSALALFRGKVFKLSIIYFITNLTIGIFDTIDIYLVIRVLPITGEEFLYNRLVILFMYSISLLFILSIIAFQKKMKLSSTIHLKNVHWSNYIIIAWTIFSFIIIISYIQVMKIIDKESNERISDILIISFIGLTLGMIIVIILMTRAAYARDKFKALSKLNQDYLEVQKQYYIMLCEKNEKTKRFQHDIKNHLLCIQALAKENKVTDITKYIKDLSIDLKETSYGNSSGSSLVDAIIIDILAKNPDVRINVNGFLPNPLYISAIDLCTVFSNIISNAVEAVLKFEDMRIREIIINIKNHENNIYINILNPIKDKVLISNNVISSTKVNKDVHGFGLDNINKCVRKYHGILELRSTEMEFTTDIVMKNISFDHLT